jgi:hypothetical protein
VPPAATVTEVGAGTLHAVSAPVQLAESVYVDVALPGLVSVKFDDVAVLAGLLMLDGEMETLPAGATTATLRDPEGVMPGVVAVSVSVPVPVVAVVE